MGTYTNLFMRMRLKRTTPDSVIRTIELMLNRAGLEDDEWFEKINERAELKDHPLFSTARWDFLLLGGSSSLDDFPKIASSLTSDNDGYCLVVQSSIKDHGEIRLLCDWLGPFVGGEAGAQIGATVCYDEDKLGAIVIDRGTLALIEKVCDCPDMFRAAARLVLES